MAEDEALFRVLHHDVHDIFAFNFLHPMRDASRNADKVAFGEMVFVSSGDARTANLSWAGRRSDSKNEQ